ncbi:MAG: GatB/YqeY domain-containing protein [Gemmatimonadetes bacterium]|nr:GatB/YqeY domain-containing protein [Gemmatimonadota bacterium]
MASQLKARLQEELNAARRARDRLRTLVLSTTLSELRNREIELRAEADDEEVRGVIARAIKKRREAAEQMRAGRRPELAEREEREAEILGAFLPPRLTEDDVRGLAREARAAGSASVGQVMGKIMPVIRGRFDGKEANRIVREVLNG